MTAVEHLAGDGPERLTGGGRFERAVDPSKKLHPQLRLEVLEVADQVIRRDVQRLRRVGHGVMHLKDPDHLKLVEPPSERRVQSG